MLTRMKCAKYTLTGLFFACLTLTAALKSPPALITPKTAKLGHLSPVSGHIDSQLKPEAPELNTTPNGNQTLPEFELKLLNKAKDEELERLAKQMEKAQRSGRGNQLSKLVLKQAGYLISWEYKKLKIENLYTGATSVQTSKYGNLLERKLEYFEKKKDLKLKAIDAARLAANGNQKLLSEIENLKSRCLEELAKKEKEIRKKYEDLSKLLPEATQADVDLKTLELELLKKKNEAQIKKLEQEKAAAEHKGDSKRLNKLSQKHASELVSWEKDKIKVDRRYGDKESNPEKPTWKNVLERKLDKHNKKRDIKLEAIEAAKVVADNDPNLLAELEHTKTHFLNKWKDEAVKINRRYEEL